MPAHPETIRVVKRYPLPATAFALAREPHTPRLFLGGSHFKVVEFDLSDDKPKPKELGAHDSYVTGLALTGSALVSGGYDGRLVWWDVDARSRVRSVDAHRKWVRGVAASPDGSVIASVADDMVCRLWDAADGRLVRELRGHDEVTPHHFPSMLFAVAFSPDGRHLATADKVGRVNVWEAETGRKAATLDASAMYTWDPVQRRHSIGGVRALAFSPDGARLATGGIGKISNIDHLDGKARVEVFDWAKGERTWAFASDKFNGLVERLAFHPLNGWLLAAGGANDGFAFALDPAANKPLAQDKLPMHVHDVSVDEDGTTVYAAGHKAVAVLSLDG